MDEQKQSLPLGSVPRPQSMCQKIMASCRLSPSLNTTYIQKIIVGTFTSVTAVPMALYAFVFPTGKSPSAIGAELWHSMNDGTRFAAVSLSAIAFISNVFTNAKYLPEAALELKNDLINYCRSPQHMLITNLDLLLALSAALAAGSLAYDAFLWEGELLAITLGLAQFITYGARRYASNGPFIDTLKNLFTNDSRFQRALVAQLNSLKGEGIHYLNEFLQNKPLNEATIVALFEKMREDTEAMRQQEPLLRPISWSVTFKNHVGDIFDFSLSAIVAYYYYVLYGQKGFDGVNVIAKHAGNNLDNIPIAAKHAIAVLPGVASAIQGFVNVDELRNLLLLTYKNVKGKPREQIIGWLILACSAISSTALAGAAQSVTNDPDNIFGLERGSVHAVAGIVLSGFGNFCVCACATLHQAGLADLPARAHDVGDVINWLHRHRLSKEAVVRLNPHRFFSISVPELEEVTLDNINQQAVMR